MSMVKDMSLAPSGLQKIRWVRDFMPALGGIEERLRREKPFAGLTIAVSVHLEAKTANLGLVLREGGAQVHLTGCNPCLPRTTWPPPWPNWGWTPTGFTAWTWRDMRICWWRP